MSNNLLIDRLAGDLRPVRPRHAATDALVVVALCGVELALYLAIGAARSDMPMAMAMPSFWWKLGSLGLIALAAAAVAISSFDPAISPRGGLWGLAIVIGLCLGAGWAVDGDSAGMPAPLARLNWGEGVRCVSEMVVLSVPPVIGLGLLMRRGAPTDGGGTALAVGIAAAAWGAFVFAFACPDDDALYIAVWYILGCGLVTLVARLVLPVLTRW